MVLRLDWCSHDAARYAVLNWHYSKSMPSGKLVKVGVWEDGKFIGAVIFGRGANHNIGKPYGLLQTEVCELVRVALTKHITPVSRIVSIATKMMARHDKGVKLVVSYADPEQGHSGAIYQAMGWVYCGASKAQSALVGNSGEVYHKRSVNIPFETIKDLTYSNKKWKHKYLLPLDRGIKELCATLAKPYPKKQNAPLVNGDNLATS